MNGWRHVFCCKSHCKFMIRFPPVVFMSFAFLIRFRNKIKTIDSNRFNSIRSRSKAKMQEKQKTFPFGALAIHRIYVTD